MTPAQEEFRKALFDYAHLIVCTDMEVALPFRERVLALFDAQELAALRSENDNLLDRLTHAGATHGGLYIANERLRARVSELEAENESLYDKLDHAQEQLFREL